MRLLLVAVLVVPFYLLSQTDNFRSRSELGVMAGGMYYIGDLNQFQHFYNTQVAGSIFYRYTINPRISFRANVVAGSVTASDADASNELLKNRNLNFSSSIVEGAAGLEVNYFPFQLGNPRYRGTAYLLAQIGLFRMNPTTQYNGQTIELQALGTEGQGTTLTSESRYYLTQLSIPLGVGFKLSLGKSASINIEYGFRKTFTDYIDDVGSNTYIDPALIANESGSLAAALSNRSLDGSVNGYRGSTTTSDWYAFFGLGIAFKLGKQHTCFYQ
jgi:hypothetical protein